MVFKVRAILFDLDGTLLDTVPDLHAAMAATLSEMGMQARTQHEVAHFVGNGIPNLVWRCISEGRQVSQKEYELALERFRIHYGRANGQSAVVYPHVRETLYLLQQARIPLACITNKAEEFVSALLRQMKLDAFFNCIVAGDTLAHKKPHPAPLLHACSQLEVLPTEALMVGDSDNDAKAARAAGCKIVLVPYGYRQGIAVDKIDCDGILSSFIDIQQFVCLS